MKPILALSAALLMLLPLPAQDPAYNKFLQDFTKALEYNDEQGMDKAVRSAPDKAVQHFQAVAFDIVARREGAEAMAAALKASFERVFGSATVLEKLERWAALRVGQEYNRYLKIRGALDQCYGLLSEAQKGTEREPFERAREGAQQVARLMQENGHMLDAAEAWALVAAILNAMPDKTLQDRRDAIYALERFKELRESWGWTEDVHYQQNVTFLKAEKARIVADEAAAKKREEEGYDPNAKGVEALVMPGVAEVTAALEFRPLKEKELDEPDYSAKGGPVPPLWWEAQIREAKGSVQMPWFTAAGLYLVRQGANKFAISINPQDKKLTWEVETGGKPKPVTFWLDPERKRPYAMAFYTGTDREKVFESELNLIPTQDFAPVFYRSAASWTAEIAGETLTFYDDNCNGELFESDPYEGGLKVYTTGNPTEGMVAPLLDSMRVGKGPRVPYSEFVKIGDTWYHMRGHDGGNKVGVRPLNPEYFKTGTIKLDWSGNKKGKPALLAIRGRGTFATAFFDVVKSKEVEVPAGEYEICFGRVIAGRGARVQTATIYKGDSQPIKVSEGGTVELAMGAPFKMEFERGGSGNTVEINAVKISLHDRSGAVFTDLHGNVLVPEVVASRDESGRGAKTIAKFTKMTDGDFVNAAAVKYQNLGRNVAAFPMPQGNKDGDMVLKAELPFRGAKVGLLVKRHPLFGKITSDFK